MEKLKQTIDKEVLADDKPWSKYLKLAEEKSGLSRQHIFLGENENSIFMILHCCVVCLQDNCSEKNMSGKKTFYYIEF